MSTEMLKGNISISEKENKLKLGETSGFSSTVMNEKLVCEDLINEFSRSIILSDSSRNTSSSRKNDTSIHFLKSRP